MWTGSMVALVTPFKGGKVDEQALARVVELQIEGGTDALVPCGTTGEAATLSHEEHTQVVRRVVELAQGRVPVIAGTGSNSTAEAIRLTREAKEAGADGALLISPYYNKPTQEGIYRHYRAVAEAVDLPLIVYNIPGRTGSRVEPETLARLAEVKGIVGVKDATGSIEQAMEVIRLCGPDFAVYSGEDALILPLMAVGAKGVVSAVANVVPRDMGDLVHACLAGEWERARDLQYRLLPLIRACFLETNPIPVKTALALCGLCTEELRLPLSPMAAATRSRLEAALRAHGAL